MKSIRELLASFKKKEAPKAEPKPRLLPQPLGVNDM